MATGIWESDKWDEQAMHEFVAVAMRSVEPLPDMSSLLQRHRIRATLGKGVEALSGPMPGTPQRSSSSPRHKSAAHGHR